MLSRHPLLALVTVAPLGLTIAVEVLHYTSEGSLTRLASKRLAEVGLGLQNEPAGWVIKVANRVSASSPADGNRNNFVNTVAQKESNHACCSARQSSSKNDSVNRDCD